MSEVVDIYLVRHGETEYNRIGKMQGRGIDEPLNETGIQQAEALAEYFSDIPLEHVISSSLLRSKQTAAYVANQQNVAVESYPELDEMGFGVMEGLYGKDVKDQLDELHASWKSGKIHNAVEGGESPVEVYERANTRIQNVINETNGSSYLFVVHGRLIRILLSKWLHDSLRKMYTIKHLNAAINHVRKGNAGYEVVKLNVITHLNQELINR